MLSDKQTKTKASKNKQTNKTPNPLFVLRFVCTSFVLISRPCPFLSNIDTLWTNPSLFSAWNLRTVTFPRLRTRCTLGWTWLQARYTLLSWHGNGLRVASCDHGHDGGPPHCGGVPMGSRPSLQLMAPCFALQFLPDLWAVSTVPAVCGRSSRDSRS